MSLPQAGLSPRVRGNHTNGPTVASGAGPIPAGAGEPRAGRRFHRMPGAYPRGCGGTKNRMKWRWRRLGLSPRVRGNRRRDRQAIGDVRPIPAGAGEPHPAAPGPRDSRAYPRGCGGTFTGRRINEKVRGLSPRVRGNRRGSGRQPAGPGPIPAGAGEPGIGQLRRAGVGAYPRGCGGTLPNSGARRTARGLSPRVRGNRTWPVVPPGISGPIPAGAGEPPWHSRVRR